MNAFLTLGAYSSLNIGVKPVSDIEEEEQMIIRNKEDPKVLKDVMGITKYLFCGTIRLNFLPLID